MYVDVVGFSNYEVSNYGKIKNKKTGRILSENPNERGYMKVSINNNNGDRRTVKMHRIVCEHFNANPGQKPQVDHKDEDKSNNRADNLRWCTDQENKDFYYAFDPSRKSIKIEPGYKVSDIMKQVCVDGSVFPSAGSAAQYICDNEPGKNKLTISKELRKMINGKRNFGTMYGKYIITGVEDE